MTIIIEAGTSHWGPTTLTDQTDQLENFAVKLNFINTCGGEPLLRGEPDKQWKFKACSPHFCIFVVVVICHRYAKCYTKLQVDVSINVLPKASQVSCEMFLKIQ